MIPECGFVFDGSECLETGPHFCVPRADRATKFFSEVLLHTKGSFARKRFHLTPWQRDDIVRPIFGEMIWSDEAGAYRRRFEVAWIELGRKNGKSEILAGIMLFILLCDGEESAELYGIAKDRKQASLIFDVAAQMVLLSPVLSRRCRVIKSTKRIVKVDTNSVYQVLASDAGAALGSNPSAVAADEILAWHDGGMWDAMRSGMGSMARLQPLLIAATTAGNDSESFGGQMHAEMQRIADDPSRSPHTFVYMRNTPREADPFDEKNWAFANPALGDFLSIEKMRKLASEAKNDPTRQNSFRQFQLNQWVHQAHRWMPMHLYDENRSTQWDSPEQGREFMRGRQCWFGMDLAARQDMTAWCLCFPDDYGGADFLWRFWLPEGALEKLDRLNEGRIRPWVEQGWLTITEGEVLDFKRVYADIEADAERFDILGGDADQWSSDPVIQEVEDRTNVQEIYAYKNDFTHMSPGMHTVMDLVKQGRFRHHGNPVARWHFDAVEARVAAYDPDLIRPDKPDRKKAAKRIDGVPAALMAVNAWTTRGHDTGSVYNTEDLLVLG